MPDDLRTPPPRSVADEFVGQTMWVQKIGPYVPFMPQPGPAEDNDLLWEGLDPHEQDDRCLRALFKRMGIHRARWETASPQLQTLLKKVAGGIDWLEFAIFDALQTGGGREPDPDLMQKADRLLTPFVEWAENRTAVTGGYAEAAGRALLHGWATKAKPFLVRQLQEAKAAVGQSRRKFDDPAKVEKTVLEVNETLKRWNLSKAPCTPRHIKMLAIHTPHKVAYRILADASGLLIDEVKRGSLRLSR